MARDVDPDLYLVRLCGLRILHKRMKTEAADTSETLASF
jgi:hypothetical protein